MNKDNSGSVRNIVANCTDSVTTRHGDGSSHEHYNTTTGSGQQYGQRYDDTR